MNAALVPVKRLSDGKSRLAPHFSREQLETLTLAMLDDILEALGRTKYIDRIAVVTPDPEVAARAKAAGAEALLRPDPGLNESIDAATRALGLGDDDALLVVLGDVAGGCANDFDRLFDAADALGRPCAVVAPSADGGSSALLRRPPGAIPSHFGAMSAAHHHAAAVKNAVQWQSVDLPALATDLDRLEDVDRFLASAGPRGSGNSDAGEAERAGGGRRTRALLRAYRDHAPEAGT